MLIDLSPFAKPRMTRSDKWKKRDVVQRYWKWKSQLQEFDIDFSHGEVGVIFYVPMPKSWSKSKKKLMNNTMHTQRPDIDNFIKALFDAVCEEDSHIHTIHAQKVWSYNGAIQVNNSKTKYKNSSNICERFIFTQKNK